MSEHDYRAHCATMIRDAVVVSTTAGAVVSLYALSHSWHSLWAMGILQIFAVFKHMLRNTGDNTSH